MKDELIPHRPDPLQLPESAGKVHMKSDYHEAAISLADGNPLLISDRYSTGLSVLAKLKKLISRGKQARTFGMSRKQRAHYKKASNLLLAPVENHQIALYKSPESGWLEKLYPDLDQFYLSFPQLQGLNSSWQWYQKGIQYPGLDTKIHPWYGVYFPTRFDHLSLFNEWLSEYEGAKEIGADIGTGCGVLGFLLAGNGFQKVFASDLNPNAVISVRESAGRLGYDSVLEPLVSDFFKGHTQKADLILFNPPWLPALHSLSHLDRAIYYEKGFFETFFRQAEPFLKKEGRLVVLFSNMAERQGLSSAHPVRDELLTGNRFKKISELRKPVASKSEKTKRRDHRGDEVVELWELALI
ncbi:MAG: methyltransferase type 11 [Balneolaceae bacterium]|nr:MAG: methyltransferase type 11 [Balneolaceae bacterium]